MFGTVAIGRAQRLIDGHRETSAPASVVALCGGRDGHQSDGVRDARAWRVRQWHWGHDGLVVAVTAGEGKEEEEERARGGGDVKEQKMGIRVRCSCDHKKVLLTTVCTASHVVDEMLLQLGEDHTVQPLFWVEGQCDLLLVKICYISLSWKQNDFSPKHMLGTQQWLRK